MVPIEEVTHGIKVQLALQLDMRQGVIEAKTTNEQIYCHLDHSVLFSTSDHNMCFHESANHEMYMSPYAYII